MATLQEVGMPDLLIMNYMMATMHDAGIQVLKIDEDDERRTILYITIPEYIIDRLEPNGTIYSGESYLKKIKEVVLPGCGVKATMKYKIREGETFQSNMFFGKLE